MTPVKVMAYVASLTAAAGLLSGCAGGSTSAKPGSSEPPRQGGSATMSLSSAIDTWNPQEALSTHSFSVFPQVYASLLRSTPDGKGLLPALASSYQADPVAKTLTFTLDPAAKFSNGRQVTSADVRFSEGLWSKGKLYGGYFSSITSVQTPSPQTVVFTLSQPDETLLAILSTANAAIFPDNYGGESEADFWKKPIGAGPFGIDNQAVGRSISLTRNPYYYRAGLPHLDKVEYKVVTDGSQRLLQFQNGSLDVVNGVELGVAAQYPKGKVVGVPSAGVSVLTINTKSGPLANVDLRKAMAAAVDYRKLVAGGYAGQATTATSLLPQNVPGVSPCSACTWSSTDQAAAKSLVAKSGHTGQNLELNVPSGDAEELAAQALAPMLAQVGIKVTVVPLPTATLIDRLGKGDFQLAMITYSALAPSPIDPLGFLESTGLVFSQSDPGPANTALTAVHAASTPFDVTTAVQTFEKAANASGAVIPLAVPNALYAVAGRVEGFVPTPYLAYCADELSVKS
ncbi:ABC transporter substrate-binding protein [Embleya hyalina]|uniref:ABC transporter substrate-binding protein n=2 Tax=Embleya hyalina TaxID=516124 RepID=A0A401YNF9_9ACTN|nr:ABC transporter substrate-binding protein [Embleya hyalina]